MKKQLDNQIVELPSQLRRIDFFDGRLLDAADLAVEQNYFDTRMRDHNRYLHGYGTVSGLGVSLASTNTPIAITVSPGVAIDPRGHLIRVTAEVQISFPKKGDVAHLVLYWAERETDFIPAPKDKSDGAEMLAAYVTEYAILKYEIDYSSTKPSGIALARLKKVWGAWKVDKHFHVRRVKP